MMTITASCKKLLKAVKDYISNPDRFFTDFDKNMKQTSGKNRWYPMPGETA